MSKYLEGLPPKTFPRAGNNRTARAGLQSDFVEPIERLRRSVAKLSCAWALSSRLTPAAIRPNERSESAFRAAANAVSAATVTPGAWPRAFRAALSRSSASLSLRGLLSAMPKSVPFREDRDSNLAVQRDCAIKRSCPGPSTAPARVVRSPTDRVQPRGGPVTVPLRSRANASPFWIMLLLV
jgi:hypothetical protein